MGKLYPQLFDLPTSAFIIKRHYIINICLLMLPNQDPTLSIVKFQQMDSAEQKNMLLYPNYPYFVPISSILTHELYLAVRAQIQEYQRIHGIQIQPKCSCKHKTKKKPKRQSFLLKKQISEQCNQEINSQTQKTETSQQKQGRNVNSNLFRMFFRRLQFKIQNQPEHIEEILRKLSCKFSLEQFQTWICGQKVDYRNYIRLPHAKKLFCSKTEERESYSKALRIIFKQFLDKESMCCYLTSKKIKKGAMKLNLAVIRTIINDLDEKLL